MAAEPNAGSAAAAASRDGAQEEDAEAPMPAPRPMCEVCSEEPSKYRCPGCERRTCSLACITRHKGESGCNGKRDRLKFVSMSNFDDRTMMSDFRLLEEVQRVDDVAKRCRPPFPKHELPPHLSTLVYQAHRRHIDMRLMNPGMHRRITNSTRFDRQAQKMMWRVEWHFVPTTAGQAGSSGEPGTSSAGAEDPELDNAEEAAAMAAAAGEEGAAAAAAAVAAGAAAEGEEEGGAAAAAAAAAGSGEPSAAASVSAAAAGAPASPAAPSQPPAPCEPLPPSPPELRRLDEKVAEDSPLGVALAAHLAYAPGTAASAFSLRAFADAGVSTLKVFMRKEDQPANQACYYAVDTTRSLGSQLAGKVVTEFPVNHLALPS
ncbi:hypothetical protein FOA52_014204 [Chlamydomonas sp. UWO 241]|nr:hypothetical protein FOA52_014204 [Chlamydomonas sp. UWO 241]